LSRRNIIEWFIRNITKDQCYTKFIEYPVIKRRKEIRFVLFVCFPFSLVSLVVGLLISRFIPKKLHNLLHILHNNGLPYQVSRFGTWILPYENEHDLSLTNHEVCHLALTYPNWMESGRSYDFMFGGAN
jgi:hypothetical protein